MNFLRSLLEQSIDTQEVMSKLKAANIASTVDDDKSNTKGFALEDDNGKIVVVRVPEEQGDDFEQALGRALNDRKEENVEIAEILFELRKQFDILDVNWEDGSIPEDEETDNQLKEPVDADVEAPDGDFPGGEEQGDQLDTEGGEEGDDDDWGDTGEEDKEPMNADDTDVVGSTQAGDAFSALQSVIDMMKADAEARKTEAEAKKAEASVEAGRVAAAAASARTRSEEEILDMENFNKRKKEEKRQRDLQAKMVRYRHEANNNLGESTMGINENMTCNFPDATPEEEEVLDMEKWEKAEKERQQREKTHERLKKFRHAVKTSDTDKTEEEEAVTSTSSVATAQLPATFKEFVSRNAGANRQTQSDIDLSHRVQR